MVSITGNRLPRLQTDLMRAISLSLTSLQACSDQPAQGDYLVRRASPWVTSLWWFR